MACPLPKDQLQNLKLFVGLCKKEPQLLHHPELDFFKEYIESVGGVVKPPKKEEEPKAPPPEPEVAKEESDPESEVDLDHEGVIEPDNDPPAAMGDSEKEVPEEDEEKSNEKKRSAMDLYNETKYEEAVSAYTEAILLNPRSALLYAKRGQCYLQLKKPNACIRDCTRALEINPDSAAAFKFRGRAHRLLGLYVKAAEDLRNACKLDFDEQADEWLKEVTPNAKKIEEHVRKYKRKQVEKEVQETRERVRRMREEQAKAREAREKAEREMSDDEDSGIGGQRGMGDFLNLMKDPEVLQAFQDPEVAAAFQDISTNPSNILKYQNNPKVNAVLKKLSSKFGGAGGGMPGMPGMGGMGGMPGFGGFGPGSGAGAPPTQGADVDLD